MPATATHPPKKPPTATATTSLIGPDDDLILVREIAKKRLGKKISPMCLWRWVRKGVAGIRLEAVRAMGLWYTTPAAFDAFLRSQTDSVLREDIPETPPPPRSAEKERKLRKAGLLK